MTACWSPPTTYSSDWWCTIRQSMLKAATGAGSDQMDLFFNEIGRTAGAETPPSQGQRKIIDELIEGCVRTPYVDEQTYNMLYELVVPRPNKGRDTPSEHMMYLLDDNAAKLPFDMFATLVRRRLIRRRPRRALSADGSRPARDLHRPSSGRRRW